MNRFGVSAQYKANQIALYIAMKQFVRVSEADYIDMSRRNVAHTKLHRSNLLPDQTQMSACNTNHNLEYNQIHLVFIRSYKLLCLL